MAKRDNINDVLRKQRNADKKVSRLEGKGIRIRNTSENPHKTPSEIRAMSPAQLRQHERRLTRFTDRRNQYEKGVDNTALPKSALQRFKDVQARVNAIAAKVENAVQGLTFPGSDTTVATLIDNRKQLNQQGMRQSKRVLNPENRTAANFKSPEALRKATQELEEKASDSYIRTTTDKRLNSIRAALTFSGNVDLVDQIDELTWSEKLLLLDYSLFGQIAQLNIDSGKYDSSGSIREGYESGDDAPVQDDELLHDSLTDILSWVRKNGSKASVRGTGRRGRGGGRAN